MKKTIFAAILMAATAIVSSCTSDNELMEDRQVDVAYKQKATIGSTLASDHEVFSDEMSMAKVIEAGSGSSIGNQFLRRSIKTRNLGSKETSDYGNWQVVKTVIGEPAKVGVRSGDDPLFTITTYRIEVNSTISNGEVEFNPEYVLEYETCSWSNGDTTIVFDIHWDILNEIVMLNGNVVNDELSTSFCEYRQTVSETGTLTTPATAMSVPFTVTIDPNHENTWLVGCSVPVNDGTMVVILSPDGTPITSQFWEGDVNASYNGAYYIPKKGKWCPCIASNHTDGMEWTYAGKSINMISYTTADNYSNWGNGNSCEYGSHSVHLTGYNLIKDTENHKLVFSFNGVETGQVSY